MHYICGECGLTTDIKPKDPIRCRFCGYRILFKMRTKNCAPCLLRLREARSQPTERCRISYITPNRHPSSTHIVPTSSSQKRPRSPIFPHSVAVIQFEAR